MKTQTRADALLSPRCSYGLDLSFRLPTADGWARFDYCTAFVERRVGFNVCVMLAPICGISDRVRGKELAGRPDGGLYLSQVVPPLFDCAFTIATVLEDTLP